VSWSVLHFEHGIKTCTVKGDSSTCTTVSIVTPTMQLILFTMHVVGVAAFTAFWICCVPIRREVWWVDAAVAAVSILVTILWEREEAWGMFEPLQRLACIALGFYRLARVWMFASLPDSLFARASKAASGGDEFPVESIKLIFLSRTAPFVQHVWPELDALW
jgi:hypothetical protein